MKVYMFQDNKLVEIGSQVFFQQAAIEGNLWIDLFAPTKEEAGLVENYLGVRIPTKEEMKEIESSSRLYQENDALIMTICTVKKENAHHSIVNVTFILKQKTLVTVRHDETSAFTMFIRSTTTKPTFPCNDSVSLVLGLLEVFIEKIADTIENVSGSVEQLSPQIFVQDKKMRKDLSQALITMGQQGEINSKTRDSLSTIARMIGYLKFNISKEDQKRFENRIETLILDASDLKDHSSFLGHKISFILDASLGLINIEQNNIIKIFSIAAVVLLPPTLVASIYGMNFHTMPELSWRFGYPIALLIMLLSAIIPYLFFKWKRWL